MFSCCCIFALRLLAFAHADADTCAIDTRFVAIAIAISEVAIAISEVAINEQVRGSKAQTQAIYGYSIKTALVVLYFCINAVACKHCFARFQLQPS